MATPRTGPIGVMLVERRPVLGTEARMALARDPSFEFMAHVQTALEATRAAQSQKPDIAVVESTLPEPGAFELARYFRLRLPATVVVLVTPRPTDEELYEAVRVGAAAYLGADIDARSLLSALRRLAEGEVLIDDAVMRRPPVALRVLAQFRQSMGMEQSGGRWVGGPAASPSMRGTAAATGLLDRGGEALKPLFVPLSAREIQIIDLVARGNSNKLIARQLGISDQTVKNHLTAILRKLEVNDRTEAVVTALRNGWIRIDAPARPAR